MRRFYFKFFTFIIVLTLVFSAGYYTASQGFGIQLNKAEGLKIIHKEPSSSTLDFSLFWKTLELLQKNYYDSSKLEGKNLLYGAISGLVESLKDPYTSFFTPEQNEEFKRQLSGLYEGIGAQLGFSDSSLVIVAPLHNSPAQKAGVQAGDEILAIDGKVTTGISLAEAVSKIRGEKGTKVTLTLSREKMTNDQIPNSKKEIFDLEIKRAEIKVASVELEWKDSVAYIRVMRFGEDTKKEWDEIVEKVEGRRKKEEVKGIILDVRNNPGGYLQAAIDLSSDFFKNGLVMQRKLSSGNFEKFEVKKEGQLVDFPVVVLINKGSASASEILAGCIWERKRGRLVGEQSFGKGTVQEAVDLEEGAGLHITTAYWLLPSGKSVDGVGLEPDVIIEMTTEDVKAGKDPQLEKGIELAEGE